MGEGIRVGPVVAAAALVYGAVVGFAAVVGVEVMRFAGTSMEAIQETSIELERAVGRDHQVIDGGDVLLSPVASLHTVELDEVDLGANSYEVPPATWPGDVAALLQAEAEASLN
ncbi:MAG: hypothetical protein NDI66_04275 [Pseudomonas sp.]|nr:hypothetical protein [Pseudomonas sp.]